MAKYRSRLDIVRDMLLAVGDGAKKTHIMYGANMSYRLLSRYLEEVLEAGLVTFVKGSSYVVTEKGRKFLERYEEYCKRRERLQDRASSVENEKEELENMCSNVDAS